MFHFPLGTFLASEAIIFFHFCDKKKLKFSSFLAKLGGLGNNFLYHNDTHVLTPQKNAPFHSGF